jgi:hypothetical protein
MNWNCFVSISFDGLQIMRDCKRHDILNLVRLETIGAHDLQILFP